MLANIIKTIKELQNVLILLTLSAFASALWANNYNLDYQLLIFFLIIAAFFNVTIVILSVSFT